MPYIVAIGQAVTEIRYFFDISKIVFVRHLKFVMQMQHEGHLAVFITLKNLVRIDTIIWIMCNFKYFTR